MKTPKISITGKKLSDKKYQTEAHLPLSSATAYDSEQMIARMLIHLNTQLEHNGSKMRVAFYDKETEQLLFARWEEK